MGLQKMLLKEMGGFEPFEFAFDFCGLGSGHIILVTSFSISTTSIFGCINVTPLDKLMFSQKFTKNL